MQEAIDFVFSSVIQWPLRPGFIKAQRKVYHHFMYHFVWGDKTHPDSPCAAGAWGWALHAGPRRELGCGGGGGGGTISHIFFHGQFACKLILYLDLD